MAQGQRTTLTVHGAQAAVDAVRRARRARDDRPLRARRRPRGAYDELWRWSVDDLEGFWGAVWEFFDVQASDAVRARARARARCRARSGSRGRGCPTPSTSSAAATTTRWPSATPASCASCRSGRGASCASRPRASPPGCGALGVGPGDRVAAYMPNIPETVAAFLATASIGAVWSSAAPEFGARVGDRPLRADRAEGAAGGRRLPLRRRATSTAARPWRASPSEIGAAGGALRLPGRQRLARRARRRATSRWTSSSVPFDHPLWVLYSARARPGLPKPIVHGQGGILLEHLKKMHLHLDAQAGDRVFWFTTTGWMMWNFLVGVLLTAGVDRPLRRQPRHARPRRAVGPRRATPAMTTLRDERRRTSRRA